MVYIKLGDLFSHVLFEDATEESYNLLQFLKENLKYENDVFLRRNNTRIPKYKTLITDKGRFLTGLAWQVGALLDAVGVDFKLIDKRSDIPQPTADDIVRRFGRVAYTPRPYQEDCIFAGLEHRRGMFDLATGAGKTIIMGALSKIWNLKTLIVCDQTDLAMQLRDDFEEIIGERVGLIGAGYWDEQRVTVAMVSTLTNKNSSKKKKKDIATFCEGVEYLMYDEVHHAQSNTWQKVGRLCKNAVVRHGFSGTCFSSEAVLEDGKRVSNKDIELIGYTGQIVAKVRTKDLIDMGYLSRPRVHMIRNWVYSDNTKLSHAEEYERIIANDSARNQIAADIVKEAYEEGKQCIVFVDRINHGAEFCDRLVGIGIDPTDVAYVTGEDSKYHRREAILDFKEKRLPIIVGTVLGEGLNFFAEVGINLAGGRSKKNTIQRIGRVLRKEKTETGDVDSQVERVVDYYDFLDMGHPWFMEHGMIRDGIYREQGHTVQAFTFDNGEMKMSTSVEPLKLKGESLQTMYRSFVRPYSKEVGKWRWKKGEKDRAKQIFTRLSEAFNVRDMERFDELLVYFESYIEQQTIKWLGWTEGSRENYIGFLLKKENIEVFAASQDLPQAQQTDIAGTSTNDAWDF